MRSYEDMEVWQRAHSLAMRVYDVTERYPDYERYVVVPQMRRSGNSVPANISEGSGLHSNLQFANHLSHASGSTAELHYWLHHSHERRYIPPDLYQALRGEAEEVQRQLYAFATYLRA